MSVLALFYMASTPLLAKRYSEKGRYYAWLILIIGLIIPFRPQGSNAILTIDIPNHIVSPVIQTWNDALSAAPTNTPIESGALSPASFDVSWWQVGFMVWLAGVIVLLVFHAIRHYRFLRTTRRWSETITDEQIVSSFNEVKSEMGISKQVQLCLCPCVGSPMMIGLVKPRILLPTAELEQDELCFILKHELVHYKRRDLLYKYLVLIARAVHWFNPLVYLMAKAIDVLCETSCDAEVVRNANADTRQFYSEIIIGVVKYRSQTKLLTALSTNFYGGKKGMKNRISSIMDTSKKKVGALVLCGALILTLGTGVAIAANTSSSASQEPMESTAIVGTMDGEAVISVDGGQTWQPHDSADSDFTFYEMSIAELERELEEFRASAGALVAFGDLTWEEIAEAIARFEEDIAQAKAGNLIVSRPFDMDGNPASIAIAPSFNPVDVAEVFAAFEANMFTVAGEHSLLSAEIFVEYEEWGLSIEGLYPNPDGGFTANPRMNVFLHGQLIRGFSDFDNGVNISISSAEQGSDEWVHVIRDDNGRILRLDIE